MKQRPLYLALTALMCITLVGLIFVAPAYTTRAASTRPVHPTVTDPLQGIGKLKPGSIIDGSPASALATRTPIKHLVVIFQENVSFDHYFATYPHAANPPGQPAFVADPNTPAVNNLESAHLLAPNNPNSVQPFRLDRSQALTCDQNHEYTAEQQAVNYGRMDKFVEFTDANGSTFNPRQYCPHGVVMGYYDGNTVTALWNYAQHYAMNDQSFGTTYGPSTPGALNLIAGDTSGVQCGNDAVYKAPALCSPTTPPSNSSPATGTVVGDPDQYYDDCSSGGYGSKNTASLAIPNVGDALTASKVSWGWFNGGFRDCTAKHVISAFDKSIGVDPATDTKGVTGDYSAHHQPFQYFASTSNPHHLPPSSIGMIGQTDQANHQYDLTDFFAAADVNKLPAVSFVKAPKYQDGHAGYSDPLDEQQFLVNTINHLMELPSWKSTPIVVTYDDSDGWYDHAVSPLVNRSNTSLDQGCGSTNDGPPARCGYGPRLPYLLISPWASTNYVDHTVIDQSSTLRFIEDNWLGFQRMSTTSFDNRAGSIMGMFDWEQRPNVNHRLLLKPVTGQPQ